MINLRVNLYKVFMSYSFKIILSGILIINKMNFKATFISRAVPEYAI